MKMGQIVSFAHDAMPDQAKELLQGLQKDAPPMAFALVREVMESELGGDLALRFQQSTRDRWPPPRSGRCTARACATAPTWW